MAVWIQQARQQPCDPYPKSFDFRLTWDATGPGGTTPGDPITLRSRRARRQRQPASQSQTAGSLLERRLADRAAVREEKNCRHFHLNLV